MPSACRNLIWNDSILLTRYPRGVQSNPKAGTRSRRKTLMECTRLARDNNLFHINLSRDQRNRREYVIECKTNDGGKLFDWNNGAKMDCSNKLYA